LFHDDDAEDGFTGNLNDLDMDGIDGDEYATITAVAYESDCVPSDDLLQGAAQELDLGSDSDDQPEPEVVLGRGKRSKQADRPTKIIPTGSDLSSDEDDEDDDEPGGKVTAKNMVARARAMDARAAHEADLGAEEMQADEAAGMADDDFADVDMADDDEEGGAEGSGPFVLPTAEEREEEKARGGPDLHTVQRRMRTCVRVLNNFARLGAGRSRSEYTAQLVADIASYYGYNEFLTEKLFQLFPVGEVRIFPSSSFASLMVL
jgi:ribosomal RNA methyltransferase Nop2